MNLRDLQYLIAVAETRHFGRAAERCFVSQPTLSGQIKKLEEELGVLVFERTNRSVMVTPVGERVVAHARLALEQTEAIQQVARAHRDPLAGRLRLGAIRTLSPYLIPFLLKPLRARYPQLKPVLSEEVTGSLMRRLRGHEIDAAIVATPEQDPDLEVLPLFDEPFWLAHPRDHPLYNKDEITREDLNGLEILLLSDEHCLARQVMEVCGLAGRERQGEMAELRAASLETLLQLVGAGFGATLVPALAMRGAWTTGSGIVTRPLGFTNACRRVRLVFRRTFPRREAVQAFAQVIRDNLPNTVRRLD